MPTQTVKLTYLDRTFDLTFVEGRELRELVRQTDTGARTFTFTPIGSTSEVEIVVGVGIPLILEDKVAHEAVIQLN